jgi:hypothetical protein
MAQHEHEILDGIVSTQQQKNYQTNKRFWKETLSGRRKLVIQFSSASGNKFPKSL